jgi:hypothetical protein
LTAAFSRGSHPGASLSQGQILAYIFGDPARFSRLILKMPLYDYQLAPIRTVLDSLLKEKGEEFLLIFPRQSGKNEAGAHLLVYLLNILQFKGGNLVFGATGDGLGRGLRRLEQRLENPLNSGFWHKGSHPTRRGLGRAEIIFMSTHPAAAARGETADWLLVIDEMQDQIASHIEAVFEPMRAASNATALYIGTVKSTSDALWQKKLALEARQTADGLQRVFLVSADRVMAENEDYRRFLDNKVARLGRNHPIVASEYFNEPIDGTAGLLDARRRALMRGDHHRQHGPDSARPTLRLATLDVGGMDEAATNPLAQLENPGRDYTVAHIFEVEAAGANQAGPIFKAVDVFVDQGSRHFQNNPGQTNLAERLVTWLEHWQVIHLVADESGLGAGLVDFLAGRLGANRVTGFLFTPAAKAQLASRFLSLVETGRFKYWSGEDEPLSDAWWFWTQAKACTYEMPAGGRFEQHVRWGVPVTAKVDTPAGLLPIHDDRLISAALVAIHDELIRQGKFGLGQAASAIIPPADPLEELEF